MPTHFGWRDSATSRSTGTSGSSAAWRGWVPTVKNTSANRSARAAISAWRDTLVEMVMMRPMPAARARATTASSSGANSGKVEVAVAVGQHQASASAGAST